MATRLTATEMLRRQAEYNAREHDWLTALADHMRDEFWREVSDAWHRDMDARCAKILKAILPKPE
jgi:hypothetical protein